MTRRQSTPFVKVPLTQGKVALISPEDADCVAGFKWSLRRSDGKLYAQAYVRGSGAKNMRLVLMHRLIARALDGQKTDHANGNGLDNRRSNLRIATTRQNNVNCNRPPGASGFRGVRKMGRKWTVNFTDGNGGRVYIGGFTSAEDAAKAYDDAVRSAHGEFARLNFPREGERAA